MSTHADPVRDYPPHAESADPDPSPEELLELFGDQYTRRVFEAVSEAPRGGREIADVTGISRATVYRRLNDLEDAGLVATELVIADDGNHHERYEAAAQSLSVGLDGGSIDVAVQFAD
ncbi:ArsR/SmtB family transcription factor [Halobacterium rubrum]|uniref:ArsR/SmtB family transcription factor n=1 Tax=Halobacterium TaxID=2239 RepID=UPI001F19207E|nr:MULTISPECIES: winged helix-turn-helix domain-containing protein [Halobacterium]MDH5020564.1 winged helix-turn-helix domain-containing protein [Halobacterium rubrum]